MTDDLMETMDRLDKLEPTVALSGDELERHAKLSSNVSEALVALCDYHLELASWETESEPA